MSGNTKISYKTVPPQLSKGRISQRCKFNIQTNDRNKNTTNTLKDTNILHKMFIHVQNVYEKKCISVPIFVAVYIVLMIKLINTYNHKHKELESKKAPIKESKSINENGKKLTNKCYEPITDEYYVRGVVINDASNKNTEEQKECTKVEIKDAQKNKLDDDINDKEENTKGNTIRKTFYIKQLESDLLTLINKESRQYRKSKIQQITNEVKERTIVDTVDTDELKRISHVLGIGTGLEPDKLESIPVPRFSISNSPLKGFNTQYIVKTDLFFYESLMQFVKYHLTAEEVLNLKSNTNSCKSFLDHLQSLKQTKGDKYSDSLNQLNLTFKTQYLLYDRHIYVTLYDWNKSHAEERYDRIWRDYPTRALQPRDHDYILSNSDATEDNLTTNHIIQAAILDYYRSQFYYRRFQLTSSKVTCLVSEAIAY